MAFKPQLKTFSCILGTIFFFYGLYFGEFSSHQSIANEHMTVIENLVKTFLPNFPTRGTKSETHSKS